MAASWTCPTCGLAVGVGDSETDQNDWDDFCREHQRTCGEDER